VSDMKDKVSDRAKSARKHSDAPGRDSNSRAMVETRPNPSRISEKPRRSPSPSARSTLSAKTAAPEFAAITIASKEAPHGRDVRSMDGPTPTVGVSPTRKEHADPALATRAEAALTPPPPPPPGSPPKCATIAPPDRSASAATAAQVSTFAPHATHLNASVSVGGALEGSALPTDVTKGPVPSPPRGRWITVPPSPPLLPPPPSRLSMALPRPSLVSEPVPAPVRLTWQSSQPRPLLSSLRSLPQQPLQQQALHAMQPMPQSRQPPQSAVRPGVLQLNPPSVQAVVSAPTQSALAAVVPPMPAANVAAEVPASQSATTAPIATATTHAMPGKGLSDTASAPMPVVTGARPLEMLNSAVASAASKSASVFASATTSAPVGNVVPLPQSAASSSTLGKSSSTSASKEHSDSGQQLPTASLQAQTSLPFPLAAAIAKSVADDVRTAPREDQKQLEQQQQQRIDPHTLTKDLSISPVATLVAGSEPNEALRNRQLQRLEEFLAEHKHRQKKKSSSPSPVRVSVAFEPAPSSDGSSTLASTAAAIEALTAAAKAAVAAEVATTNVVPGTSSIMATNACKEAPVKGLGTEGSSAQQGERPSALAAATAHAATTDAATTDAATTDAATSDAATTDAATTDAAMSDAIVTTPAQPIRSQSTSLPTGPAISTVQSTQATKVTAAEIVYVAADNQAAQTAKGLPEKQIKAAPKPTKPSTQAAQAPPPQVASLAGTTRAVTTTSTGSQAAAQKQRKTSLDARQQSSAQGSGASSSYALPSRQGISSKQAHPQTSRSTVKPMQGKQQATLLQKKQKGLTPQKSPRSQQGVHSPKPPKSHSQQQQRRSPPVPVVITESLMRRVCLEDQQEARRLLEKVQRVAMQRPRWGSNDGDRDEREQEEAWRERERRRQQRDVDTRGQVQWEEEGEIPEQREVPWPMAREPDTMDRNRSVRVVQLDVPQSFHGPHEDDFQPRGSPSMGGPQAMQRHEQLQHPPVQPAPWVGPSRPGSGAGFRNPDAMAEPWEPQQRQPVGNMQVPRSEVIRPPGDGFRFSNQEHGGKQLPWHNDGPGRQGRDVNLWDDMQARLERQVRLEQEGCLHLQEQQLQEAAQQRQQQAMQWQQQAMPQQQQAMQQQQMLRQADHQLNNQGQPQPLLQQQPHHAMQVQGMPGSQPQQMPQLQHARQQQQRLQQEQRFQQEQQQQQQQQQQQSQQQPQQMLRLMQGAQVLPVQVHPIPVQITPVLHPRQAQQRPPFPSGGNGSGGGQNEYFPQRPQYHRQNGAHPWGYTR